MSVTCCCIIGTMSTILVTDLPASRKAVSVERCLEKIASPEHYCDINNVVGSIGQLLSPFKATKDVKVRMAKKALRILIRFDKKKQMESIVIT